MDILGLLATAEGISAVEESGFGFSFNILESNLVNLLIVIGVLVYAGRNFLGNTLSERKSAIEAEFQEVEDRRKSAAAALAEQQQNLAQSKVEAERILAKAQESAKVARESILAEAAADVERMKASAVQDLNAEQERVIAQLRQQVVSQAIEQSVVQIKSRLDDSAQSQLIDQSLAMMGGRK
ncbi:MAG: F0F1 ATP synthase subunit B [Prochlorotrichaceae cyanobacterium]|jgi:F-type H+-transporting ATPase subunit b